MDGDEADFGEDLVGVRVGEEGNGGHAAEDHWSGGDLRREKRRRGGGVGERGLFGMTLGKVVDGGVDGGDSDGGSSGGFPDGGVHVTRTRRRRRVCGHFCLLARVLRRKWRRKYGVGSLLGF